MGNLENHREGMFEYLHNESFLFWPIFDHLHPAFTSVLEQPLLAVGCLPHDGEGVRVGHFRFFFDPVDYSVTDLLGQVFEVSVHQLDDGIVPDQQRLQLLSTWVGLQIVLEEVTGATDQF